MTRWTLLIYSALAAYPAAAGDAKQGADKKELARLKGVWEVNKLVYNGKDFFANGAAAFPATGTSRADDETAKELKRLEGVWASTPAKKGRDRGHVLVFQGGKMGWQSFQTRDGKPVIGHAKLYEIQLDPKASPKQLTATWGEGNNRGTRRAIYELAGDTLKIAFSLGRDGERPRKFQDEDAEFITLTRDKQAKVPDLSKAGKRGKETPIEPTMKWFGHVRDASIAKQCPEKPITTRAEFEKVWKALRGADEVPKVDFAKEFVLVQTSTAAKLTAIGLLVVEGKEQVRGSGAATYGEKIEGFTYAIGVFRRELVDVVNGRIVARGHKKK
jgi:uncharacterized protein (TIGR03067 family)